MDKPILRSGDFFCTCFPGAILGKIINRNQKKQSTDNKSELTHSGFIVDSRGTTFEALSRYRNQNIWEAYGDPNTKLLIGRHKWMDPYLFTAAYSAIRKEYTAAKWAKWVKPDKYGYRGKAYPWWRLFMHKIPGMKKISLGPAVCSEVTMKMLFKCLLVPSWKGWNPDNTADYTIRDKLTEIIYAKNIVSYDHRYFETCN